MENTIIIKEDGLAINAIECCEFALAITFLDAILEEKPPPIELRAIRESEMGGGGRGDEVLISTFYEIEEACGALSSLLEALQNNESEWDVRDYNSNL